MRRRTRIFLISLCCLAAAVAGLALLYRPLAGEILAHIPFSRVFLDRDGKLLRVFLTADDKYRAFTPIGDFPPELVQLVLLQEDRRFYSHAGIDPAAMIRAGWETYIRRSRRIGASTITMQLARLRWGIYTKSLGGKLLQTLGALFLELCYSKQEILEAYLNLAPFGGNVEGYAAASWRYFNKPPRKLSLGEMLSLVVIPQNPQKRTPRDGLAGEELLRARAVLLEAWAAEHPDSRNYAAELPPHFEKGFQQRAYHFADYLEAAYPPERGAVRTTVALSLQTLLEEKLAAYLQANSQWGIDNGSLLLLDYTTMEVLGAVGSADFFNEGIEGQVNGFAAKRSPGSTLKPFIYALAMEQGLIYPEKMLKDAPASFSEYTPDNYKGSFKGPVKAWYALTDSRNIPAVNLASQIQNPDLYDFLDNAGVAGLEAKETYGLSIVLGSAEMTMLELCRLYAALANNGEERPLRFLLKEGGTGRRLLSPEAAAITVNMLERNPAPDLSRRSFPAAYKTGTSIGFKDAWSVAIFDRYVLAAWLGNFSGKGNNALIGRETAAVLGFSVIDAIMARIPEAGRLPARPMPAGAALVDVCAVSGDIPGEDCPQTTGTWFIPGVSPIGRCRIHRRIYIDNKTGYRTDQTEGPGIYSEVREFWPTDLLEIFAEAGLPRLGPPPYPPDKEDARVERGYPPGIISPLSNSTYILRDKYDKVVLLAGADQDSGELYWFANTVFLGKVKPQERFVWEAAPGDWVLTAVDSRGRSSGVQIKVIEQL